MRYPGRGRKLVPRQVGKYDRNIWKCNSPKGDENSCARFVYYVSCVRLISCVIMQIVEKELFKMILDD